MISPTEQRYRSRAHGTAASAVQALLAELQRVDERLRRQVGLLRAGAIRDDSDQFRGLYVSDADVDAILDGDWPLAPMGETDLNGMTPVASAEHPPLRALVHRFNLDAFDLEALLICLAPEINLSYERLYAYLQDDVTRKRPTIDLVLNLLCPDLRQKLVAWQRFATTAPLLHHELLIPFEDQSSRHPPRLATFLKVDERVVEFLLGQPGLDQRLSAVATLAPANPMSPALHVADGLLTRLQTLAASALHGGESGLILNPRGPAGVGRQTITAAVCGQLDLPMLVLDLGALVGGASEDEQATLLRRAAREARLLGAALYCDNADGLAADDRPAVNLRRVLANVLDSFPGLCFVATSGDELDSVLRLKRPLAPIEFPPLDHAARVALWRRSTPDDITDDELEEVAGRFRLNAAQIEASAQRAANAALGRDPNDGAPTVDDLFAASRRQATPRLGTLARKIKPRFGWDDIVLPPDQRAQLSEIVAKVRYSDHVLETWGFDRTVARGRGINALFSGPSGTGKTMAAEIMAGELGIDLYKIDLSTMVSKYIGETEKNLERLFTEAEHSGAILFFDEADAIFGKRSEVKDAHDRYANMEVGYLLQRIEEYEGIVILATNLRKNMDDAFVRRLHMSVEFPFPEEEDRLKIWSLSFPASAPLADDVDLAFMARRFKLAGGNIKNVALASAFLAAADDGVIHMAHLIRGTRREYQKLGKLIVEAEFGQYMSVLRS